MERKIFEPEHNAFRETARRFYEKECLPNRQQWERDGVTSREVWLRAGELGLLGWEAPEKYGGQGLKDFRYNAILTEEKHATGAVGPGLGLQNDVMPSYLIGLTTEEQQERWLPGYVSGEIITAIAMSEPGAGSDLAGIRTTAVRDGDHYVVNGAKTFISSGILADLVVTVVKTDPAAGHKGISLLAIERGMPGFERGRKLDKIGQRASDTAELSFTDVRVPVANLLGEENRGFYHLMGNLPAERLAIAVNAAAQARRALDLTRAIRRRAHGFRHSNRFLPGQPARDRRHDGEARHHAGLRGPVHRGRQRRRADPPGSRRREDVGDRDAVGDHRPLPPVARRVRLHQRVRDRPAVA